jgi:hypothetical protein
MTDSFRADERAIEGLPIRLVIALVVGVASLSVMMNMIAGAGSLGVTEVDVRPHPDVVETGPVDLTLTVVDPSGRPVSGATVVARAGSARLEGVTTGETGNEGNVTLSLAPGLGPNQVTGSLTFEVKPPAGEYVDRRENTGVLVVRDD